MARGVASRTRYNTSHMLAAVAVKQRVEDKESQCGHVWCSADGPA